MQAGAHTCHMQAGAHACHVQAGAHACHMQAGAHARMLHLLFHSLKFAQSIVKHPGRTQDMNAGKDIFLPHRILDLGHSLLMQRVPSHIAAWVPPVTLDNGSMYLVPGTVLSVLLCPFF